MWSHATILTLDLEPIQMKHTRDQRKRREQCHYNSAALMWEFLQVSPPGKSHAFQHEYSTRNWAGCAFLWPLRHSPIWPLNLQSVLLCLKVRQGEHKSTPTPDSLVHWSGTCVSQLPGLLHTPFIQEDKRRTKPERIGNDALQSLQNRLSG
ncbi:hypothetical protein EMCRGX_G025599 [Ephydatia muelleri]